MISVNTKKIFFSNFSDLLPGARYASCQTSWEEDSQGTAGTMDTAENMRLGVSFSGLPDSDDGEDDEDLFETADNLDLGAVDLCVSQCFAFPHGAANPGAPEWRCWFKSAPSA